MNVEHRARQAMRAMLTPEQVQLYQTNALFKSIVDEYFMRIVPTFLSGAVVEAEAAEEERAKMVHDLMRMPVPHFVLSQAQVDALNRSDG